MLDLDTIYVDEIATALADQTDYEHRWLIDPRTGEVLFWTSDSGIDGANPVDLDELDLIPIDPLPSYISPDIARVIAAAARWWTIRRNLLQDYQGIMHPCVHGQGLDD